MFNAAILLAQQYNINIQGQFIKGQTADSTGTPTDATAAACKVISTSNIVGIVGPAYSRDTPSIAGLGQRINIPVISYAATDPALSDRNAYPTFYRTIPSDSAVALAITKLFLTYGWTSCTIIYQNDAFGSGGVQAITDTFLKNGLTVAGTLIFDIATGRTRDNLQNILIASSTRIIVLWMTSDLASIVLQDALQSDVLGPNYQWILSTNVDLSNFNKTLYPKLIGMLTIEPTVASINNAPINTTLLNAAFDLWKQYEPETFAPPNNVNYYALFAFDAAWTLIQSLAKFCSILNNGSSSCISLSNTSFCFDRHFLNSDLLFHIINNTTFLGVSGLIQFNPNTTDRMNGSYYVIRNAQSSSNGLDFVKVLSYSDDTGWQRDPFTQLIWPGNSLIVPSGRPKLEGIKLKLGLVVATQFANMQNTTDIFGNTTMQIIGYLPDLIDGLKTQLKFIADIQITPFDRMYDALIDDVANGVYDLVLGDITVTADRKEKVDFSSAIFDNSLRIIMRKERDIEVGVFSFLKPLSWDLWLVIVGTLISTSILVCILEREANEGLREKSFITAWAITFWYSCCNFMGRDTDLQPKTAAGRLLFTALFFLTLVIVASYTANLASELTISKSKSIITGIDDIKNGKIPFNRIGIGAGTSIEEYFLREVSGGSRDFYPLRTYQQMYDGLFNKKIDVAFLDTGISEYITNNIYCNLTLIGEGFDKSAFALVMRKGWLYARDLDIAILSLREAGDLDDWYRKWFQLKLCPDDPVSSDAIETRSLIGLFMLFGIIWVLSLSIYVWNKWHITENLSRLIRRLTESCNKNRRSAREDTTRSSHNIVLGELRETYAHNF